MSKRPYADFLPRARRTAAVRPPQETWWSWQGHEVHIARARRPRSRARVLLLHGAGGYSGALWPVAAQLAAQGLDVAAVDLPLYGRTRSAEPERVRYPDWVRLCTDLVAAERDGRPLILLGASLGGMLACEVAARSPHVSAVAVTCLLDPQDRHAQARMTKFGPLGVLGGPLAACVRGRLATTMIPMRWVADLSKMSLDPELSQRCAEDPRGGGALVPLGFLASYLQYRHVPPARLTTPVTLLHPELDTWTPVELSLRTFHQLAGAREVIMLRGCGHFPIEEPGLTDLVTAVDTLASTC